MLTSDAMVNTRSAVFLNTLAKNVAKVNILLAWFEGKDPLPEHPP
tara:strand:+ start:897 stop:1031 length:135 start_codon:yes stop_codon:yes gene_type:complete